MIVSYAKVPHVIYPMLTVIYLFMYKNWQVNLVINYDLPMKYGTSEPDCEVYLHRIGRAGRFGRKGK